VCIIQNGGRHHDQGQWWYHAGDLPDGRIIKWDEDMAFSIKDLSSASPRSALNTTFTYNMDDINGVAMPMGTLWKTSKDIPFGTVFCYIGLKWDIEKCTVALPDDKREKYTAAIAE
jgi:hypothetical protein